MDNVLREKNLLMRDTHPRPLHVCETWGHGNFLHVCFSSVGCRFRKAGYCTMCDYGGDRNLTAEEAAAGIREALSCTPNPIQEILLGTCGSILDEEEMPWEVLGAVMEVVRASTVSDVILETHYTTVTPMALERVRDALPEQEIVIEMGYESANPDVLEHSLCKYMDLNALADSIKLIRAYGMFPVLNVFLGAPFLTPENQIQDAERAIAWAVDHGANRVVVFPANIKPNTLLWNLYQEGKYRRISHWMLIELLSRLNDSLLEKVELSWYGDRQAAGRDTQVLPPESCPQCQPMLMRFYQQFMGQSDSKRRRLLLEELCGQVSCDCRSTFQATLTGVEGTDR